MLHLSNLCLLSLLCVNFLGLTLVTGLWIRNAWLALVSGPWIFCSIFFFVENFYGFGQLSWLWPLTTTISVVLVFEVTAVTQLLRRYDTLLSLDEWRNRLSPLLDPSPYLAFLVSFIYVVAWRYKNPNIDGHSEKLSDLANLSSYLSGATIPVHDVWLYPFLSTYYYGFQYYAGALLGRILGLDPGTTYNLAFCAIVSFTATAGIGAVFLATRIWLARIVVCIAWLIGGSGVTVLTHFVLKTPYIWGNTEFIGYASFNHTFLGTFLRNYAAHYPTVSLPGEPLSYLIYIGDYHPPLAGFYLLTLVLLALNVWSKFALPSSLCVVGASLPWCAISDTWNLPLQALGLIAWAAYNLKPLYAGLWRYLLVGMIAGMVTIYPYFRVFAVSAQDYQTVLRWVPDGLHTPPLLWLLFFLPTFVLTVASLCSRDNVLAALGILWLIFLVITECFYINDVYRDQFIRFNSTLKWWPLVTTGTLLTVGPRLLELKQNVFIRTFAFIFISYPILYGWDLASVWLRLPARYVGQLDGTGFLFIDKDGHKMNDRLLLSYLRTAPRGVVIEHPGADFSNYAAMTTLSGQQSYLGWLGHEGLWRGYPEDIQYRYMMMENLYNGNLPNAGEYMQAQGVTYILWFKDISENKLWKKDFDLDDLWSQIDSSLHPQYVWHEFYRTDQRRVGLWEVKAPRVSP
jgi:hypothetical protein